MIVASSQRSRQIVLGDSPRFNCCDELLVCCVALRPYSSWLKGPVALELDTSAGLQGSLATPFPISHCTIRVLTGPLPAVAGFIKSRLMTGKRIRAVVSDKRSHPRGSHGDRRAAPICLTSNCQRQNIIVMYSGQTLSMSYQLCI